MAGGTSIRERVRDELLKRAKAHPVELVTYGSLAKCLGVHVMAVSNKKMLDRLSEEEIAKGLPDITFLLTRQDTHYSGQIGMTPAPIPDINQKAKAKAEMQKIIDHYSPGSINPYQ